MSQALRFSAALAQPRPIAEVGSGPAWALRGLQLLLLLALTGSLLKNAFIAAGAPNLVPLVREPLLLLLFVYGACRLPLFNETRWRWLLLSLLGFVAAYIASSMVQDRAIVGFYYLRVYALPMLFAVALLGVLRALPAPAVTTRLIRFLLLTHFALFVLAVALYVLLLELPSLRPALFGSELLPVAWFISGGTWMRMGLPASGPNNLGALFACNALLFMALRLLPWSARRRGPDAPAAWPASGWLDLGIATALLGLVMTFSRSAALMVMLGTVLLLLTVGELKFTRIFTSVAAVLLALALALVAAIALDIYSEGMVTRWVELNLSGRDPSALGHAQSLQDAVKNWAEYIGFGYPRGTVGPRALMFTGNINNVESGFLALIYDMGLFNLLPYSMAVGLLFAAAYTHRAQFALLLGLCAPMAFLPVVFESDLLIYAFFVFALLGRAMALPAALPERA